MIEEGTTVKGGSLDAQQLVDRALNEGRAEANTELLKQADLKDRLRRFELATLASRIESILNDLPAEDESGKKSRERLRAEAQVRKEIADFESRHGQDTTGLIAAALRKFKVDYYDLAPTVLTNALNTLHVLAGARSQAFLLPVTDDRTAVNLLKVTATSVDPGTVSVQVQQGTVPAYWSFVLTAGANVPSSNVTKSVEFSVRDEGGNETKASVPLVIHRPELRVFPGKGVKAVSGEAARFQVEETRNRVVSLGVAMELFQSSDEGWTLNAKADPPVSGLDIRPVTDPSVSRTGPNPVLTRLFRIDPSLVRTNNEVSLIFIAEQSSNRVATTSAIVQLP